MYCIKCGVRLADTEKSCPLCHTPVFHPQLSQPEVPPLYPDAPPAPQVRSKAMHIVLATLFFLAAVLCAQCDLLVFRSITWSGYVIGSLCLVYSAAVLPFWFWKPNPVIFVPCSFGVLIAFLFYINFSVGGNWFLTFALPVAGFLGLLVTAVITLLRYINRGALYICGGGLMALGGFMPLMGYLLNLTFDGTWHFSPWSTYPMTALVLLGGMLIFLAICRPARESVQRRFFI